MRSPTSRWKSREHRVTAVIGPNGAGKTTLFNVISGFYPANSGSVRFAGEDLLRRPAHKRAALGIARTFQNIALFPGMTVEENIKLGAHAQLRTGLAAAALFIGPAARDEAALVGKASKRRCSRCSILSPTAIAPYRVCLTACKNGSSWRERW